MGAVQQQGPTKAAGLDVKLDRGGIRSTGGGLTEDVGELALEQA